MGVVVVLVGTAVVDAVLSTVVYLVVVVVEIFCFGFSFTRTNSLRDPVKFPSEFIASTTL